jgi:hypothetical protein
MFGAGGSMNTMNQRIRENAELRASKRKDKRNVFHRPAAVKPSTYTSTGDSESGKPPRYLSRISVVYLVLLFVLLAVAVLYVVVG